MQLNTFSDVIILNATKGAFYVKLQQKLRKITEPDPYFANLPSATKRK